MRRPCWRPCCRETLMYDSHTWLLLVSVSAYATQFTCFSQKLARIRAEMFNPFSARMHHMLKWIGLTKDNMNGLWVAVSTLISRNWSWQNLLHRIHCAHAHILGMIVHVCLCTRAFVRAFDTLWYSNERPSGGHQVGEKREGWERGREAAQPASYNSRFIVWGWQPSLVFIRLKTSALSFFKLHLKQPPIINSSA